MGEQRRDPVGAVIFTLISGTLVMSVAAFAYPSPTVFFVLGALLLALVVSVCEMRL